MKKIKTTIFLAVAAVFFRFARSLATNNPFLILMNSYSDEILIVIMMTTTVFSEPFSSL